MQLDSKVLKLGELYFLLGDEIEDRDERKAFIRSAISTTRKADGKP